MLRLELNDLATLQDELAALDSLRLLDLSYNSFTTLPDCVGRLQGLEELVLDHNVLHAFPEPSLDLPRLKISQPAIDRAAQRAGHVAQP